MAVLNKPRAPGARLLLLCLALIAGAGCSLLRFSKAGPGPLVFSHRLHVQVEQLECINCHEDALASDQPGMPVLDMCSFCHDEVDADKPADRRIALLFPDADLLAMRASKLSSEVLFSHQLHAAGDQDCSACHVGIEQNERITQDMRVSMQSCMDCHKERSVANECSTCHSEIRREVAPLNHQYNWTKLHGRAARSWSPEPDMSCAMCHAESTCAACHKEQAPANHTNYFRRRSHGPFAALDRKSCALCHEPATCDRCHQVTRPLNHTGSWGSQRNNHCVGCHFPIKSESCTLCHKTMTSHLLGAPKPPDHTPALNCRQCHGLSAPLPHVDKGDDCNACHL